MMSVSVVALWIYLCLNPTKQRPLIDQLRSNCFQCVLAGGSSAVSEQLAEAAPVQICSIMEGVLAGYSVRCTWPSNAWTTPAVQPTQSLCIHRVAGQIADRPPENQQGEYFPEVVVLLGHGSGCFSCGCSCACCHLYQPSTCRCSRNNRG
jgi:hypothetical protein